MKQMLFILFLISAFLLTGGLSARAPENLLKDHVEKTQTGVNERIDFNSQDFSSAAVLGNQNAPITITEFTSVSCSHCATYYTKVFSKLKKEYIDTGLVKIISVHFPYDPLAYLTHILLQEFPPHERHVAMLKLFQNQNEWLPKDKSEAESKKARSIIMKTLGVQEENFNISSKTQKKVDADLEHIYNITQKYGIAATPSFFINGIPFNQDVTFENFKKTFDSLSK